MFDVIRSTVNAFSQMRVGPWQVLGDVLLVGEGNLSFAKSLLNLPTAGITALTATTFENGNKLSEEARQNAAYLKCSDAQIVHGIDATHLDKYFRRCSFDTIIFQFPNVGSREAKHGQNPNHIMVRKFLRSAKPFLAQSGTILISTVDSPHYEGVFKFYRAAEFAGFAKPETYPFDPGMFHGYSHVNTNEEEESALDDHNRFITWVFKAK